MNFATLTPDQEALLHERAALEAAALSHTVMRPLFALYLPIQTGSRLNVREHWATVAEKAKKHRQAAHLMMLGVLRHHPRGTDDAIVQLIRVGPRGREELDDDNLRGSLKAVRDGVADALKIDDGDERVRWLYAQLKGERYAVIVRVWYW